MTQTENFKNRLEAATDINDKQALISNYVKSLAALLDEAIPNWRTKNSTLNKILSNANVNQSYIGSLYTELNKFFTKNDLDKIKQLAIKLVDRFTQLNTEIEKIKADKKIATTNVEMENLLKDFDAKLVEAQAILDKLNKNINKKDLSTFKDSVNKALELVEPFFQEDWKFKFSKAAQKDYDALISDTESNAVGEKWNEYVDTVWKNYDKDIINKIGPTLNLSLKLYGYTAKDNPLINFLQKSLDQNKTFASALKKDYKLYSVIHNAVANNLLSTKDLLGKGVCKNTNIIFSTDLYNHTLYDIREYLRDQHKAISLYSDLLNERIDETESSKFILDRYKDHINEFIVDLFFNPGDILNLNLHGSFTRSLHSLEEIDRALNHVFGKETVDTKSQEFTNTKPKSNKTVINTTEDVDKLVLTIKKNLNSTSLTSQEKFKIITRLNAGLLRLIEHWSDSDLVELNHKYDTTIDEFDASRLINRYFENYDLESLSKNSALVKQLIIKLYNEFIAELNKVANKSINKNTRP